jgi:hypothetical protein
MTVGHGGHEPLAAARAAMPPGHVGRGPGLVDEDQLLWLQLRLLRARRALPRRRRADPARRRAGSFFSRQPAGGKEAADRGWADLDVLGRQAGLQLGDGEVRFGRKERLDPLGMVGELGALPAADLVGLERAALAPALHQLDHEARADVVLGGGRVARYTTLDRPHHPFAQIHRIRSRHSQLASSIQQPVANHNNRTL